MMLTTQHSVTLYMSFVNLSGENHEFTVYTKPYYKCFMSACKWPLFCLRWMISIESQTVAEMRLNIGNRDFLTIIG